MPAAATNSLLTRARLRPDGPAMGRKSAVIHVALIAMLLRGFLPAGWMPAAQGEAPLTMCSVMAVANALPDAHSGDGQSVPAQVDPRAHESCAFSAAPGVAAPDDTLFFTPVLQDGDIDAVDYARSVRLTPGHTPQSPRAPPLFS